MQQTKEEWNGFDEDDVEDVSNDMPDDPDDVGGGSSRSASPASESYDAQDTEANPLPGTIGHLPSFPTRPLSPTALAAFNAAQDAAGVVYISRIPPGMQAPKVRHLMGAYGEVGRVYLQQEDPKRAYLRRTHTATKKAHYTEGWVEFLDKRVARSVASLLNAQPVGGKKGSRWRDDVWTMKYLPRFKWGMLTEHVVHEAAVHRDRLRVELSQGRAEQREYLKQVELARVLDKRRERKRLREEEGGASPVKVAKVEAPRERPREEREGGERAAKRRRGRERDKAPREGEDRRKGEELQAVLGSVF